MQPTRTPARSAALVLAAALFAHLISVGSLDARPKIRQAFFSAYPSAVGSALDNLPSKAGHCGVCHYDFNGGGTRNPYGLAVGTAINLAGCGGNDQACMQTAMLSAHSMDHDGDGVTTLAEITDLITYANTPTFPGLSDANVGSVTNVSLIDLVGKLVPTTGADVTPPVVQLIVPNGGEVWTGGSGHPVQWNATDDIDVVAVDLFYRDGATVPWTMIARDLPNSGTFTWFVHNTPTPGAQVRVVARDAMGNAGADSSDAVFTILQTPGGIVATTLRDFKLPGTQPFGGGSLSDHTWCVSCHGSYDPTVEPGFAFKGMMMAQSMRDPLFEAALAIAEQDAPSSGDLCLRCHTPMGWLSGRSQPTNGSLLHAEDRDGVNCDFCHRAVDPIYKPGVSPPEDQGVLAGMLPAHVPSSYSNGQYVLDPDPRQRGPFGDPVTPHTWLESAFHRSSDFCGTCHDVSNPVFDRLAGSDYALGPLDQPADSLGSHHLFPLERTYSEWKFSSYPAGVFAPEFAGSKPDGMVSNCQDCHMPDVIGRGCNDILPPIRDDLPFHGLMGGNSWMPGIIAALFPGETDAAALAAGAARAVSMLQRAATLDLQVQASEDSLTALVTVTNRAGHKLPTGYPEGRRMWIHLVARDSAKAIVYESGAYDPATGVLSLDPNTVVYEAKLGISPALASTMGRRPGESFHFTLNDTLIKDNRIPPLGFRNADFEWFGGAPVDASRPAPRYADGQNWDASRFTLPATARTVGATLYYQTTSKEYVEFLRDQNTTNNKGQVMYDLWAANGRATPVAMASDSMVIAPVGVPLVAGGAGIALRPLRNPFHGTLELQLYLPRGSFVRFDVFDAAGRRVTSRNVGMLASGTHRLAWDDRHVSPGVYWVRISAGGAAIGRQVVRLR